MSKADGAKETPSPRRLAFYSLGFLRLKLRKRLNAIGIELFPFGLGDTEGIIVWGRKPVSKRGIKRAHTKNLPLVTIEDGFIRSIKPGWQEAPRSLSLDQKGVYFDTTNESELHDLIATQQEFDEKGTKEQIELQVKLGISKYNQNLRKNRAENGYILVVDQVRDDQSIAYGQASEKSFRDALDFAKTNFPRHKIKIRTHPAGKGYYSEADCDERTTLDTNPQNPFDLIEGAEAVIVVTSQMGFDAILAGVKPFVFGQPFYAGWGLTEDKANLKAKMPKSREALYNATINEYCQFFTKSGARSSALTEIFALYDEARQIELAHQPLRLENIRAWKIPHMKRFFPNQNGAQILRWGQRNSSTEWVVEDGFLRSRGLGATLVPPLSLVVDKTGIYFDPTAPSDLETYIHARQSMLNLEIKRAQNLQKKILDLSISKYNLPLGKKVQIPSNKEIILVVGQVEDDRSILLGATGEIKTNRDLLKATRKANPEAFIIYKPHPDVEAGLRKGKIEADEADLIYADGSIETLWPNIDHLATITSLSGFEALLRGKKVSCFGMPFYADWGLTTDYAPSTNRRGQATLEALIYASLIDYPLYLDPKGGFTTPEIIIDRIASGETYQPAHLRALTWTQQKFYRFREWSRKSSAER